MVAGVLLAAGAEARPATGTQSRAAARRPAIVLRSLDQRAPVRMARNGSTRRWDARAHMARLPGMGRRDAFSPAPMASKERLLGNIQRDARFRKHLAKHFGVSEARLVDYVEDNVQLFALNQDLKTDVYAVTKTGRHYKVRQRIPRGSLVFGLPEGVVLMKSNCGNPVMAYLPPVGQPVAAVAPEMPAPAPLAIEQAPETVEVARETLPDQVAGFIAEEPEPEVVAIAPPPVAPPVVEAAPAPVVETAPAPVAERRRRRGFPWYLAGLGLIPLIDGDDGGRRRRPGGGGGPAPQPVPEPGTLVLFGAGALAMLATRRRGSRPDTKPAT